LGNSARLDATLSDGAAISTVSRTHAVGGGASVVFIMRLRERSDSPPGGEDRGGGGGSADSPARIESSLVD